MVIHPGIANLVSYPDGTVSGTHVYLGTRRDITENPR